MIEYVDRKLRLRDTQTKKRQRRPPDLSATSLHTPPWLTRNLLIRRDFLKSLANQNVCDLYLNIRHALKGYKVMILGRNTALDNILIIGIVLTNVLHQSYSPN
ncbi:hypothetical protein P8452_11338 [Trifolium repens]|nr:hypothetical protein P8452_11338 [Trifolium repens]